MADPYKIQAPYYPIVYVRGYAMTADEREETFNDAYYGFSASSVEKRQATPDNGYQVADIFEGQMIRFMKIKDYGYADSVNYGLRDFHGDPSRSIWVCRFYDQDYIQGHIRKIEDHAADLAKLILVDIPAKLEQHGVTNIQQDYKVILIAHSMGGLVCRTLLQNILQQSADSLKKQFPNTNPNLYNALDKPLDLIHRLVTIATPHKGIELGNIPSVIQRTVTNLLNPFDSSIFMEKRMRDYLKLPEDFDLHSLGNSNFPVKRCLSIIGSDYKDYNGVKYVTGGFSDGLVKQSNAYIVSGKKTTGEYDEEHRAYFANVHRSHSGHRGIVNSYETYENIQRFLFGDLKIRVSLNNLKITSKDNSDCFYDIEFSLSIRGTAVYLHRREQDLCENAIRLNANAIPNDIHLHTAFLNSALQLGDDNYSYFLLKLKVQEYRPSKGLFWDTSYPASQIFSESVEIKIDNGAGGTYKAGYRWLSDGAWNDLDADNNGQYILPLLNGVTVNGNLVFSGEEWHAAGEAN